MILAPTTGVSNLIETWFAMIVRNDHSSYIRVIRMLSFSRYSESTS